MKLDEILNEAIITDVREIIGRSMAATDAALEVLNSESISPELHTQISRIYEWVKENEDFIKSKKASEFQYHKFDGYVTKLEQLINSL